MFIKSVTEGPRLIGFPYLTLPETLLHGKDAAGCAIMDFPWNGPLFRIDA